MEWKASKSLWNYNFLSICGRKHMAFITAHRQRGCRQHIIVSERNSFIAKKSAEMVSLNTKAQSRRFSGTQYTFWPQKWALYTFCQQVNADTWDSELLQWKWKIWQYSKNNLHKFQECLPTSRVLILAALKNSRPELKAGWMNLVHPKLPKDRISETDIPQTPDWALFLMGEEANTQACPSFWHITDEKKQLTVLPGLPSLWAKHKGKRTLLFPGSRKASHKAKEDFYWHSSVFEHFPQNKQASTNFPVGFTLCV